jgi:acyl carrier protein
MEQQHVVPQEEVVLDDVIRMVDEVATGWDHEFSDEVGPETRLVADLGFESMDMVMLLIAIEGHYQRQNLPFDRLLTRDGQYVADLRIGDVVDFLVRHLPAA